MNAPSRTSSDRWHRNTSARLSAADPLGFMHTTRTGWLVGCPGKTSGCVLCSAYPERGTCHERGRFHRYRGNGDGLRTVLVRSASASARRQAAAAEPRVVLPQRRSWLTSCLVCAESEALRAD